MWTHRFFQLLVWLLIARVIISWLPVDPYNKLVRYLYRFTEPMLKPLRFAMVGTLDFSPFLAIILLQLLDRIVYSGLIRLFY
ncbi:MAG: YggT family protein [Gracilibacteraceae bacterium]|nr:YggT family protein [Gracilibacteraceae bacterium]